MSPVEAYIYNPDLEEDVEEYQIAKGKYKIIDFFEGTQIFVFCDSQDNKGVIQINGDTDSLEVMRFKDEDAEIGENLDQEEPIEFSGPQIIEIYSQRYQEIISLRHIKASGIQMGFPGLRSSKLRVSFRV